MQRKYFEMQTKGKGFDDEKGKGVDHVSVY